MAHRPLPPCFAGEGWQLEMTEVAEDARELLPPPPPPPPLR